MAAGFLNTFLKRNFLQHFLENQVLCQAVWVSRMLTYFRRLNLCKSKGLQDMNSPSKSCVGFSSGDYFLCVVPYPAWAWGCWCAIPLASHRAFLGKSHLCYLLFLKFCCGFEARDYTTQVASQFSALNSWRALGWSVSVHFVSFFS